MAQEYLIGIDLGTSVVKTSLFDTGGNALADATRETALHQPAPGRAEQQGDDFYAAALETLKEVVDKTGIPLGSVAAITFDGQMAGAIAIDDDLECPDALVSERARQPLSTIRRGDAGASGRSIV